MSIRWNRSSFDGNQSLPLATQRDGRAIDSCFVLIRTHQYGIQWKFGRGDSGSHQANFGSTLYSFVLLRRHEWVVYNPDSNDETYVRTYVLKYIRYTLYTRTHFTPDLMITFANSNGIDSSNVLYTI